MDGDGVGGGGHFFFFKGGVGGFFFFFMGEGVSVCAPTSELLTHQPETSNQQPTTRNPEPFRGRASGAMRNWVIDCKEMSNK